MCTLHEEKWDSVRSVLKVAPVTTAWEQSQKLKNPLKRLADLEDDVEKFETVDDIAAALQLAALPPPVDVVALYRRHARLGGRLRLRPPRPVEPATTWDDSRKRQANISAVQSSSSPLLMSAPASISARGRTARDRSERRT